jgi:hypothetical protein
MQCEAEATRLERRATFLYHSAQRDKETKREREKERKSPLNVRLSTPGPVGSVTNQAAYRNLSFSLQYLMKLGVSITEILPFYTPAIQIQVFHKFI